MQILCNKILTAKQYIEGVTGKYFIHVDTLDETKKALLSQGIAISNGICLMDMIQHITQCVDANPDAAFVFVEFSTEEDFTQHEVKLMRVPKRYIKRFKRFLEEEDL